MRTSEYSYIGTVLCPGCRHRVGVSVEWHHSAAEIERLKSRALLYHLNTCEGPGRITPKELQVDNPALREQLERGERLLEVESERTRRK